MGLRLLSGHGAGTEPTRHRSRFRWARADFEAAWRRILPTLTEANFQEWHDQHDWTAKKYANVGARRTDAVSETKLNDALCLR
jgi:hypothetical protein